MTTTYTLRTLGERVQQVAEDLRNLPLFTLACVVSLSVEVYAWGAILNENVGTVQILGYSVRLAYPEVAMSTAFSLAALVLGAAAASMKNDLRPKQQRRATAAQALAVVVLLVPVYYASNAIAYQAQLAAWREYSGSEAEAADRLLANDLAADSITRREAAKALRSGIQPERAEFDLFSFLWVALVLGCNMAAVRFGWRARAETPEEAKSRIAGMRAAKAKETRERNKRARQKEMKATAKSPNVTRLFR